MLIVEQRRVVAEALARAFDRAGLTVAGTALTANAALPLAHALRPDVVVIDHHVLDRGAPHLIGTIRTLDPEVQVVVVGGGPTRDEMVRALQAGAVGYLLDVDSADRLIEAVKHAAGGEMVIRTDVLAEIVRERETEGRPAG